jgi:NADH dehydrogenase
VSPANARVPTGRSRKQELDLHRRDNWGYGEWVSREANRIVIVGGGFAGFWAAVAVRRVAPAWVDVALVSRAPVLEMRPRLYEAQPERLQVDLLPLLKRVGVEFVQGNATALDHADRTLLLGDDEAVRYGRLVIATGSTLCRPPLPGADGASSIDTVQEAIAFDRRLAQVVHKNTAPTIALIGAGFTGIELALELRDRIRHHGAIDHAERARILLFDRANVLGPDLGAGPRPVIQAALAAARVELRLRTTIVAIEPEKLVLRSGETIEVDAVVLTTGMAAAGFTRNVPGDRDDLGRIRVDQSLRNPAAPGVFVAGDAAAVDCGDGHGVLQSCQHALQLGRFAGENAARDILRLPLIPYKQPPYVTCLDLGGSGAVFTRGWQRIVELTGADAKAVKRRINTEVIYPPTAVGREELLAMSSVEPGLQRPRLHRLMERNRCYERD